MGDSEWWCVERANGSPLLNKAGQSSLPNKETAVQLARDEVANHDKPLTVVKYTRKEIKTVERMVSIKETDLPAV